MTLIDKRTLLFVCVFSDEWNSHPTGARTRRRDRWEDEDDASVGYTIFNRNLTRPGRWQDDR